MSIFSKSITTLNIESDSIRLLQVKGKKVKKFGEAPIPPGLIRYTMINEPETVAEIISALFKRGKVSRRNVIVSMNGFRSVARYVYLPKLGKSKMDEAVKWAAEREMPVPLDTLCIWWQVLETSGNGQMVFLIGIPRNLLNALKKTLSIAGVKPKAIDSKPIALSRLSSNDNAIIADLENETISVVIKADGVPAIMHTLLMNADTTEIEDKVKRLSDDLFRTIEYYTNANKESSAIDNVSVCVSGGMITDGIPRTIQQSIGRKISLPDPVLVTPEEFPVYRYATNIGLFLRETKHKKTKGRSILKPDIMKAKIFTV
ncbi:MAG: pilus assembly protein PilM [Dehalococcoidales bacterium]|nr:pilus assembly protein PilM [Dehalococcoidales bacterium]